MDVGSVIILVLFISNEWTDTRGYLFPCMQCDSNNHRCCIFIWIF